MKQSLMKFVLRVIVLNLFLHLISVVSSVAIDFVLNVKAVKVLCANHAHRKISFLCKEFCGTNVDDCIISTRILPSLFLA